LKEDAFTADEKALAGLKRTRKGGTSVSPIAANKGLGL
jgi:hypothetical protein